MFSSRRVAWLLLLSLLLSASSLGLATGRDDEEEEAKPKPPKRVPTEVEEANPKSKPIKKVVVEDPDAEPGESGLPALPATKPMTPPGTPGAPKGGGGSPVGPETTPPSTVPGTPGSANTPDSEPLPEAPAGVYLAKLDDLSRAATSARHPALRDYFLKFTYAFDQLYFSNGRSIRITPVPLLWGTDRFPAQFGIAPLDDANQSGEVATLSPRQVSRIDCFEKLMVEESQKLITPPVPVPPNSPSRPDALAAAERGLTALLFFHDAARDSGKRRGKSWEPIKTNIYETLTTARIARLKQTAVDRNWPLMQELSRRYLELYKTNPKALEQVYSARLLEAEVLVKSEKVPDLERGRELLNQYEARYPGSMNESANRVRETLALRAKNFLASATKTLPTNASEARNLLRTVEAIDPNNPDLRQLQSQLKTGYPVLIVGTRRPPLYMSPALARTDSEQWATELLFEGLLEAVPDSRDGVRFPLSLAAERPTVGAGVRNVSLVRAAEWGGDRGYFDAADVAGTIRLLRQVPESPLASVLHWLDDPGFDPTQPGRIRMRFKLGHPDPRSLLTFKIQPAQWLLQSNKKITDPEFALKPFGTGPYRLDPRYTPPKGDALPGDVVFLSNPDYSRRPGNFGLPFIKEIRFQDVSKLPDLTSEFRGDRMHILTDVPTTELGLYSANNNLNGRVRIVTPSVNRRLMILAINHRRATLQNVDLRRGLLHAIDRDRVLNEVYRGTMPEMHKALTGPFPPNSWATPKSASRSLYNRDLAASRFRQYYKQPLTTGQLNLLYPSDDPQAKTACERMKAMIESCTATEERKLAIMLEPLPPRDLLRRVELEQSFDLAYIPWDYSDDWYALGLGRLLDPSATGPGGRNFLGYPAKGGIATPEDDKLMRIVEEVQQYRDPQRLEQLSHNLHRAFNEAVPFVPLWQLDRHLVLSTTLKIFYDGRSQEINPQWLDPSLLFHSVANWKLE